MPLTGTPGWMEAEAPSDPTPHSYLLDGSDAQTAALLFLMEYLSCLRHTICTAPTESLQKHPLSIFLATVKPSQET